MRGKSKRIAALAVVALSGVALLLGASFGTSSSTGVNAQTGTAPTTCPAAPTTTSSATSSTAFGVTITVDPASACGQTGQTFTFKATLQNAGMDTSDVQYLWNFGDNNIGSGPQVTHTYGLPGTYLVQVFAQGSNRSASASTTVTVLQALQVKLSGPAQGAVGQPLTFTVAPASGATVPADTTYAWDFGDNTGAPASTSTSVTHVYTTTGIFTVKVMATSASAARTGTDQLQVTIGTQTSTPTPSPTPVPTINLTINGPAQANTGQTVNFSVNPTGSVPNDVVYTFTFGDNSAATTGSNVSHIYTAPGLYNVTVTASSASNTGFSGTATKSITIAATGPSVSFQAGWNIVSGPAGMSFSQCDNPLYTFQANDAVYEVVQNTTGITSGRGYFCYFAAPTSVSLVGSGTTTASIPAPANQYVMIGNPSSTATLTIHADYAVQYDPVSNSYQVVTTLAPGHGAFALNFNGGTITIGP